MKIYPNPSTGSFKIQLDAIQSEKVLVQIVDVKGVEVFVNEYTNMNETFIKVIHLKSILKGVYLVKIKWVDEVYVEKMIVY